jgi:hypothetical protein
MKMKEIYILCAGCALVALLAAEEVRHDSELHDTGNMSRAG